MPTERCEYQAVNASGVSTRWKHGRTYGTSRNILSSRHTRTSCVQSAVPQTQLKSLRTSIMPHFDQVGHSVSAPIAAITDYYTLLVSLYLDDSSVEWPPEGGWPQLTPVSMKAMNKSASVISLLRQIPYLRELDDLEERDQPHGVPYDNSATGRIKSKMGSAPASRS